MSRAEAAGRAVLAAGGVSNRKAGGFEVVCVEVAGAGAVDCEGAMAGMVKTNSPRQLGQAIIWPANAGDVAIGRLQYGHGMASREDIGQESGVRRQGTGDRD
jgi:hypothetical protein